MANIPGNPAGGGIKPPAPNEKERAPSAHPSSSMHPPNLSSLNSVTEEAEMEEHLQDEDLQAIEEDPSLEADPPRGFDPSPPSSPERSMAEDETFQQFLADDPMSHPDPMDAAKGSPKQTSEKAVPEGPWPTKEKTSPLEQAIVSVSDPEHVDDARVLQDEKVPALPAPKAISHGAAITERAMPAVPDASLAAERAQTIRQPQVTPESSYQKAIVLRERIETLEEQQSSRVLEMRNLQARIELMTSELTSMKRFVANANPGNQGVRELYAGLEIEVRHLKNVVDAQLQGQGEHFVLPKWARIFQDEIDGVRTSMLASARADRAYAEQAHERLTSSIEALSGKTNALASRFEELKGEQAKLGRNHEAFVDSTRESLLIMQNTSLAPGASNELVEEITRLRKFIGNLEERVSVQIQQLAKTDEDFAKRLGKAEGLQELVDWEVGKPAPKLMRNFLQNTQALIKDDVRRFLAELESKHPPALDSIAVTDAVMRAMSEASGEIVDRAVSKVASNEVLLQEVKLLAKAEIEAAVESSLRRLREEMRSLVDAKSAEIQSVDDDQVEEEMQSAEAAVETVANEAPSKAETPIPAPETSEAKSPPVLPKDAEGVPAVDAELDAIVQEIAREVGDTKAEPTVVVKRPEKPRAPNAKLEKKGGEGMWKLKVTAAAVLALGIGITGYSVMKSQATNQGPLDPNCERIDGEVLCAPPGVSDSELRDPGVPEGCERIDGELLCMKEETKAIEKAQKASNSAKKR